MQKLLIILFLQIAVAHAQIEKITNPVEYVNPLMGTASKPSLSNGNTYPAIARPWGMNFWTPQTGKMGDGWAYTYDADKIRGFKQTHQPSPWMNDYGQFSIMPLTGMIGQVGSPIKRKLQSPITIVSTLQIMTSPLNCHQQKELPSSDLLFQNPTALL
jgi:putative alpha-1,2-mannosidase